MKIILIYFLFTLIASNLLAQSKTETDKLNQIINDIKIGEKYKDKSFTDRLLIVRDLYYRSKEIGYDIGTLSALTKMAEYERFMRNTASSLKYAKDGIELALKINSVEDHVSLLNSQSYALIDQGYYSMAKKTTIEALELSTSISDKDEQHWHKNEVYTIMAEFYSGLYPEEKLNQDSVKFYDKLAYQELQKISKKSHYYKKANVIMELYMFDINFEQYIISNRKKHLEFANDHLVKAYELANKWKSNDLLILVYNAYFNLEIEKGNIKEAIIYCKKMHIILNHYNLYYESRNVLELMSKLYAKLNDHKSEAHYLNIAKSMTDSLQVQEKKAIKTSFFLINQKQPSIYNLSYLLLTIPLPTPCANGKITQNAHPLCRCGV